MPFNSIAYLAFLGAVAGLFLTVPARFRRTLVLLASIGFYGSWSPAFLLAPIALAIFIRFLGHKLVERPDRSGRLLWWGVSGVIAALVLFKTRSLLAAIAPIGISFYSFEAITYLVDLRQKRIKEPPFADLLLYLLFWPTVVSGPILRGRELFPQLKFDRPLDARLFISGLDRIVWGLVQKNALANTLGSWVDSAFASSHTPYSTLDAWTVVAAYGLQIYLDFSAYSNMAIGSAQLIGIRLPENFRYPYHAATPPDFWSRWHMSLSRCIRDYLFFPLNARYRGAPAPLYLSLIGVMALVGLWHGAGWGFLIWGALHGTYLVLYRFYESRVGEHRPALMQSRPLRLAWRIATLAGVIIAWAPFRSRTLQQTADLLRSMLLRFDGSVGLAPAFYYLTAALACFCFVEPFLTGWLSRADESAADAGPALQVSRLATRPLLYAAAVLVFLMFGGQPAQFIYFQF